MPDITTEQVLGYINTFVAILGYASIVARLTPTDADNKVIDFIFKIINTLGLTKPKGK